MSVFFKKKFAIIFLILTLLISINAVFLYNKQNNAKSVTNNIQSTNSPVFFIGFSGLYWSDIDENKTPNLYRFSNHSASALMVPYIDNEVTCPIQAWLTLREGEKVINSDNTCKNLPSVIAQENNKGKINNFKTFLQDNTTDNKNNSAPTPITDKKDVKIMQNVINRT